jgi:mannose-6-phosphate isomerase
LEVQEPTDFTIQPERWCDRYRLSDEEMYLGLDKAVALSCFDLQQTGLSVIARGRKKGRIEEENDQFSKEVLISIEDTPCFSVNRFTVRESCELGHSAVYVVTGGEGELISPSAIKRLKKGSYFFVPYAAKGTKVRTSEGMELIECLPPR